MDQEKEAVIYDKVGITSAVLCTIHCLAVPILFFLKGLYADGATVGLPGWWHAVDYVFLIVSFAAVYHSAGHTPSKQVRRSLWLSWLMLALAIFIHSLHWMAYIASIGLIMAHFINIRRMRLGIKKGPVITDPSSIS